MTHLEGNEIIASFIGGEIRWAWKSINGNVNAWYGPDIREYRKYHNMGDLGNFENQAILTEHLKFHSDWNCLIPVVEKIEKIKDEFHGHFGVSIYSNGCSIQGTKLNIEEKHYAYFAETYGETKILAVWQAVVMFIKWYNQYKENESLRKENSTGI